MRLVHVVNFNYSSSVSFFIKAQPAKLKTSQRDRESKEEVEKFSKSNICCKN